MYNGSMGEVMVTPQPPNGRACGKARIPGSVYASCGLSANGMPLEYFLVDPVIEWPGGWQRGADIVEFGGAFHLVIFVGREPYPSPWDYFEETRLYGVSRKISNNMPFEKLMPGVSMMLFVHARTIPLFYYKLSLDDHEAGQPMWQCKWRRENSEWADPAGKPVLPWLETDRGYHPAFETPRKSCTMALRDLTALMRDTEPLVKDGGELPGYRQVNMPSNSYTLQSPLHPLPGNGKVDSEGNELKWGGPANFLAQPLTHFEFCKEANAEAEASIAKAGFQAVVLDY